MTKRQFTKAQFKAKEKQLEKKKLAEKNVIDMGLECDRIPKISQSLIKSLYRYKNDQECGLIIDQVYIKGNYLTSTEPQALGNYFEYICTGALPRDKTIPEVQLTQSGKPTIFYERIHKQKENFDRIMLEYGFEIEKVGHEFTNPKYSGIADIIALDKNNKKSRVIIDLKCSSMLNDKWSAWGWHSDSIEEKEELMLQAIHYKMLAKYEWGIEDIPFYFFVFSNKNATECKVFEIIVDESTRFQHTHNLKNTKLYLDEQLQKGFQAKPEYMRCQKCPLRETCLFKVDVPIPQKVYI